MKHLKKIASALAVVALLVALVTLPATVAEASYCCGYDADWGGDPVSTWEQDDVLYCEYLRIVKHRDGVYSAQTKVEAYTMNLCRISYGDDENPVPYSSPLSPGSEFRKFSLSSR